MELCWLLNEASMPIFWLAVLVQRSDVREARGTLDTSKESRHEDCVERVVGEASELHACQ